MPQFQKQSKKQKAFLSKLSGPQSQIIPFKFCLPSDGSSFARLPSVIVIQVLGEGVAQALAPLEIRSAANVPMSTHLTEQDNN